MRARSAISPRPLGDCTEQRTVTTACTVACASASIVLTVGILLSPKTAIATKMAVGEASHQVFAMNSRRQTDEFPRDQASLPPRARGELGNETDFRRCLARSQAPLGALNSFRFARSEPRVNCPLTPGPSPSRGEGRRSFGGRAHFFRRDLRLLLLPSPLEGEGSGVRGLRANGPQLVILTHNALLG